MNELLKETIVLRHQLHAIPEPSNHEVKTKAHLMKFINEHVGNHPCYEMVDCGQWFYVVRKSLNPKMGPIAFRADFDAVTKDCDHVEHLCGHDGHSSTLAGFLTLIKDRPIDRDIYFLFQNAEENGDGGQHVAPILKEKGVKEVYAYHNIPGYDVGTILLRPFTFALASTGLRISFEGHVSHAAYPELGANPSFAIAQLIKYLEAFNNKERDYIEFATIVGVNIGNDSFGVSAGDGTLSVTIRSEKENNLNNLIAQLKVMSEKLALSYGLKYTLELVEPFPATYNHREAVEKIVRCAEENHLKYHVLEEPFRWSEDFGHYTKETIGAMVGIGDGKESTFLHTDTYFFNDDLIPYVWLLFASLL